LNIAIILSGGIGSRVKGIDTPKQYVRVLGRPVIYYVLCTVLTCSQVEMCLVVAAKEYHDLIREQCEDIVSQYNKGEIKLEFALPGESRQLSILNGLNALEGKISDDSIVAVIDAARPNMTGRQLSECFDASKACDGVLPVLPMKDTIYMSEDEGHITGLLDRRKLFAGQAPECFRFKKYLDANKALLPDRILSINGSSEPAVLAGMKIKMISGDEKNYKITTIEDLERFKEECTQNQ